VNPRSTATWEHYRKVTPAAVYARAERAEACTQNGLESAAFFTGAVLAGNFAGWDAGKLCIFSSITYSDKLPEKDDKGKGI
jgi:uncharacterized MAPEG superfamily protein